MTIAVVAVLGSLELKSIQAVSETKEKQSFTIHDQEICAKCLQSVVWTKILLGLLELKDGRAYLAAC